MALVEWSSGMPIVFPRTQKSDSTIYSSIKFCWIPLSTGQDITALYSGNHHRSKLMGIHACRKFLSINTLANHFGDGIN